MIKFLVLLLPFSCFATDLTFLSNSRSPVSLEQELADKSFSYMEVVTFVEMHLGYGLGFQPKTFYTSAQFSKFNDIGRPLEYTRRQEYIYDGMKYLFQYVGGYEYDSNDQRNLKKVNLTGSRQRTPVDAEGNPIGQPIKENEQYVFEIASMTDENILVRVSFERKLTDGTLTGYYSSENPIQFKYKNRRIYAVSLSGNIEFKSGYWTVKTNFQNTNYDFKTACKRLFGATPSTRFVYDNSETQERKTWEVPITSNEKGALVSLSGTDYKYELQNCQPW